MTDVPRMYVRHLRQSKTCMNGARPWFAKLGWSWQDFLDNGRPLADFEATGCPMALPAIESARKEAAGCPMALPAIESARKEAAGGN